MLINCTSVYHKKHTFTGKKKKWRGKLGMCVCVWVGRLQWKCISCITFLFLIFHALWIYLNPLRWIEKEKKEKEEVRDMQNKKHPPLANVLPLSSLGFLIISSLFSSFTWGHFFWSHLPMLNPNHGHTVFEEGKQGSGRADDRLCVPDWNYGWSLRWWMDSFACFKPSTVEAKGWEGPEKYSDSLKERGGMWWMSNIGNGLVFFGLFLYLMCPESMWPPPNNLT